MTSGELEERIDRLIDLCDRGNEPPTAYIIRRELGIGEEELEALRDGSRGKRFAEAAKRLDEYRAYFWTKKALNDPKWATFSTFNIKELRGGDEEGRGVTLTVKLDGVGKDAFD